MLSISKLTSDFPLSTSFTENHSLIQSFQAQKVVANSDRVDGLYVLKRGNHAFFLAITK